MFLESDQNSPLRFYYFYLLWFVFMWFSRSVVTALSEQTSVPSKRSRCVCYNKGDVREKQEKTIKNLKKKINENQITRTGLKYFVLPTRRIVLSHKTEASKCQRLLLYVRINHKVVFYENIKNNEHPVDSSTNDKSHFAKY